MILTTPEKLRSHRRKLYVKAKAEPATRCRRVAPSVSPIRSCSGSSV